MTPFEKQDIFHKQMIEDYKSGKIPNSSVFEPYFKWKMGLSNHTIITKKMAYSMIDEAVRLLEEYYAKYPNAYDNMDSYINDDVWQQYKGFGEDKYIVSYLEGIEGELSKITTILNH